MRLSTTIHDRDVAGLTYVYPVVSRRARGVSIGINLNTNNACNWRCAYCQVQDLQRGAAAEIDLELLRTELRSFLQAIVQGDYMQRHVPEGSRRLNDVAISGNGEPTTSAQFDAAVVLLGTVLDEFGLRGELKVVLITNGSQIHKPHVQAGLRAMATMNGEVWYKLDSATPAGRAFMNDTEMSVERAHSNLALAASLCRTRLQTCMLAIDGEPPGAEEQAAYLAFVQALVQDRVPVQDVLLYGLERTSYQPEAARLGKLPASWLEAFAQRIRATGLDVQVHP
jgi:wyosine [tRNA(Phe)-imidazoG37] synthetase (radical SAM superfamily)